MKSRITNIRGYEVTLEVPKNRVNSLVDFIGMELDVDIQKSRNKRSLDANGYLWVLCGRMAEVLGSTKWEIYKHELKKWSSAYTYMVVEPKMAEIMKSREDDQQTDFRCVEILNNGDFNGKPATQILAYLGSHLFDSKQMSTLLNGVIEDCKELGIETDTPDEIERMAKLWGK